MHQPVCLQQAVAVEAQLVPVAGMEAPLSEGAQLLPEPLVETDAELVAEIAGTHMSQLELEDQLADHPLLGRGREGTIDREAAGVEMGNVRLEMVIVLIVRSTHVRERRH